jgi:phosphatidylglycerophosphate synthase
VRPVHAGPVIGLFAQVATLAALESTVGLGGLAWVVGIGCSAGTTLLLGGALTRHGGARLRPADWVTLARVSLSIGVAALVAEAFVRPAAVTTMLTLAAIALALDGVDGWVARRTRTAWPLGARFDMEVDAFLILVLSIYVARTAGAWVLAIGFARYAFVAAGWSLPWLREPVPRRYWCKVVAAAQGVVLAAAVADLLPRLLTAVALGVALALLAESFGRQVWWLWRHRPADAIVVGRPWSEPVAVVADRSRLRRMAATSLTVAAVLLVWFGLVAPDDLDRLTPVAFLRVPLEGIVLVLVVLALPRRAERPLALAVGAVLGALTIWKIVDMGFNAALGRPFEPVLDWSYFGSAEGVLADSIGRRGAIVVVVAAVVLAVVILVLTPLAVLRLVRVVDRHRATSLRTVTGFGVVWVVFAALGVQVGADAPVASTSAAALGWNGLRQVRTDLRDEQQFAATVGVDPIRSTPTDQLLTGLRGKDVIVAFVESYGRSAVQGSSFAPGVDRVLDASTRSLHAAGFDARSAYLTSPTFGGISWLAHSTLQSGLWVDNQARYNHLVASDRFTLSDAFKRAGWRTVVDVPSNTGPWPEATSFYHYDQVYNAHNVGYAGPKFSYAAMPDQYSLAAFRRRELAPPGHVPVMAEIDLVSSHTPWTPLPHMVPPGEVGDGSIFDGMPAQGQAPSVVWRDRRQVQASYGRSVQYSLNALVSFVRTAHDDNLVLVVLGDHQPAKIVSGEHANHDVPISIIAHDPSVLDRISAWGWQDGLHPSTTVPVWPMDAFRNRFLNAYDGIRPKR